MSDNFSNDKTVVVRAEAEKWTPYDDSNTLKHTNQQVKQSLIAKAEVKTWDSGRFKESSS